MESARTLLTLGDKEYGNAIGIYIIHAVISANDAITIHFGEVRTARGRATFTVGSDEKGT
jgi:hypothetical protein